jgi:hypothetical protein
VYEARRPGNERTDLSVIDFWRRALADSEFHNRRESVEQATISDADSVILRYCCVLSPRRTSRSNRSFHTHKPLAAAAVLNAAISYPDGKPSFLKRVMMTFRDIPSS